MIYSIHVLERGILAEISGVILLEKGTNNMESHYKGNFLNFISSSWQERWIASLASAAKSNIKKQNEPYQCELAKGIQRLINTLSCV